MYKTCKIQYTVLIKPENGSSICLTFKNCLHVCNAVHHIYRSLENTMFLNIYYVLDSGDYIIGGDITKAGKEGVDYLSGLRGSCGPPARVQGSLIFKNGEPLTEVEQR